MPHCSTCDPDTELMSIIKGSLDYQGTLKNGLYHGNIVVHKQKRKLPKRISRGYGPLRESYKTKNLDLSNHNVTMSSGGEDFANIMGKRRLHSKNREMNFLENSTLSDRHNKTLPKKRIIRRHKEDDVESVKKYLHDTSSQCSRGHLLDNSNSPSRALVVADKLVN